MGPHTTRSSAIARGLFAPHSPFFKANWPDVTLLTLDLLASYRPQIEEAARGGKGFIALANARPFHVLLNASSAPAKALGSTLAPLEIRFRLEEETAASISLLDGPDGALRIVVDDDLSDIAKREKAREIEDRIIEALKAEIARRAA